MSVIKNTYTGRFDANVNEVMDHVRKPVFVDNAIHHARIDISGKKHKVTIEKNNASTYQTFHERSYKVVEGESDVQITHHTTPGHSYLGEPYLEDATISENNKPVLLYNKNALSERLLTSTVEDSTIGSKLNLRNMKGQTLNDIGFTGEIVNIGQVVDVGLRSTDLAMKLGEDVADELNSVNISHPRVPSNSGGLRRIHSTRFIAQDFQDVNLITALKHISRQDNRIILLDKFGNLMYVPFMAQNSGRKIVGNIRLGGKVQDNVDDTPNRITVQGTKNALNDNNFYTLDDVQKQSGTAGEIRQSTIVTDLTVKDNISGRRTARKILKSNSINKGRISSGGHPYLSMIRPGMTVIYDGETRLVSECQHDINKQQTNIVLLNIDTGIEGVLQDIADGSVVVGSIVNPQTAIQVVKEEFAFFSQFNLRATLATNIRRVGSDKLIIGTSSKATVINTTCDTNHTSGLSDGSTTNVKHVTIGSTANLEVGMFVSGDGIPANTTIAAINNATCFTLSANPTATNTNTTFTFSKKRGMIGKRHGLTIGNNKSKSRRNVNAGQ